MPALVHAGGRWGHGSNRVTLFFFHFFLGVERRRWRSRIIRTIRTIRIVIVSGECRFRSSERRVPSGRRD